MTIAERWLHIKKIVGVCLEMDGDSRHRYLDRACGSDSQLRMEVQGLLDSHDVVGGFLAHSILEEESQELPTGTLLGAYEIAEFIAEGGMGSVYRAFRVSDFKIQAAVKVVKRGMDTSEILRRFRDERQILANLRHPGIARVLDGGATQDGRPFLVMEFIEGCPILDYCNQESLPLSERLELFRQVCAAVHYAHQNLVIHRDIKSGNILVGTDGLPKLLDFGIAKLMEAGTDSTAAGVRPLTPECASPEQVRGEAITTATDVYALGVLLYQLLGGEPPFRFDHNSLEEVRRVICESEPARPSSLRPLPADLDTIVLKAMHKEPGRRYASAAQLSEDIQRFLNGLPVMARQDSWVYRMTKFLVRHKTVMALGLLLMLTLLGGLGATLWQAHRSETARLAADQRYRDVRALATSNLSELNSALENLPASASARHLLIQRALEYLDKLRKENPEDSSVMHEAAVGYERIAQLQGRFIGTGVGDAGASLANYRKAVAIRSLLVGNSRRDSAEIQGEIRLLCYFVASLLMYGTTSEAVSNAQKCRDLALELVKNHPTDPSALIAQQQADLTLAWVFGGFGGSASTREFAKAIALDREAVGISVRLPVPSQWRDQLIVNAQSFLALHTSKAGDSGQAVEIFDHIVHSAAIGSVGQDKVVEIYNRRANALLGVSDHHGALLDYRRGLTIARKFAAEHSDDQLALLSVEILNGMVAIAEARLGRYRKAWVEIDSATERVKKMFEANPEVFYRRLFVVSYLLRAEILSDMGDEVAARANLVVSLGMAERSALDDPSDLESKVALSSVQAGLGVVCARNARFGEAQQHFCTSLALARRVLSQRPDDREVEGIAKLVEHDLAALSGCGSRECARAATQFRFPNYLP